LPTPARWELALGADTIIRSTTCLGCGCACDDIDVVVREDRIVEPRNACALGSAWFGDGVVPARVLVAGRSATIDEAMDSAASLLMNAARPLVYLAPDVSCEAQREAVAVADLLRAALDSVTSSTVLASILAQQERGRAAATLGEIRNRADVLVFWGVDPSLRYPRYATRYAPDPPGVHVPDGRRSRTVVAVDVEAARGPSDADVRIAVTAADEVATLTAVAAMAAGAAVRLRPSRAAPALRRPGTPDLAYADAAAKLTTLLTSGRYVVIVADAEPDRAAMRDSGRPDALVALAQALNGPTRAALSLLRGGGNRSGADAVMTWQTGFPVAVDFSRGYPRYRPFEASANLQQRYFDAALVLGAAEAIPEDVLGLMDRMPAAVVGPRASDSALAEKEVVIDTAVAGIHEGGTALRMDDVPLPLRPSVPGPPAAADLAAALRARIANARRR
jgi:formylmethanofuran dehydrogenase subunit B